MDYVDYGVCPCVCVSGGASLVFVFWNEAVRCSVSRLSITRLQQANTMVFFLVLFVRPCFSHAALFLLGLSVHLWQRHGLHLVSPPHRNRLVRRSPPPLKISLTTKGRGRLFLCFLFCFFNLLQNGAPFYPQAAILHLAGFGSFSSVGVPFRGFIFCFFFW